VIDGDGFESARSFSGAGRNCCASGRCRNGETLNQLPAVHPPLLEVLEQLAKEMFHDRPPAE